MRKFRLSPRLKLLEPRLRAASRIQVQATYALDFDLDLGSVAA